MYASIEDRKAYAKQHYLANKGKYNKSRTAIRTAKLQQKDEALAVAKNLIQQSQGRFIYPDELDSIATSSNPADGVLLLKAAIFLKMIPADIKKFGLFLGRAPFAFHSVYTQQQYLRRLSIIPKSKRGIKAEIMILEIIAKDSHGRK